MLKSRRGILALLTALNLVNYIDRFVVMAVAPKLQEDLDLSDTQIGLVISVFMFGYFLTSPIFGWLGDRYGRKGLIAAGVAVWSLATVLSGVAGTLATMLLTRVAVGVGEASYATLGPTIIDDIATKKSKNRWLSIFYIAIPVGSALGFLLGGWIQLLWGWRTAFFVAGGPGLVLAACTLLIVEPKRGEAEREEEEAEREASARTVGASGAGDVALPASAPAATVAAASAKHAYVALAKTPLYVYAVAGYVAQTFALGGFTAWAAPFLYRRLCLDLHLADTYFGAITVVTGLVGTGFGGWLADRWPGADRTRVCLRVCALSSAVAAPIALLAIAMPSPVMFLIALGVCELAVFVSVSPTNAAVLISVPPALRASAMAASIFAIHLLGDLISPPIIGTISDRFGDKKEFCSGGAGLQLGMALLPVALAVSALVWWLGARQASPAARPGAGPISRPGTA